MQRTPRIASQFIAGRPWRGVADTGRWAAADAMRRFWLLILLAVGLSLLLGGFTYLAIFASIPYQEPTLKMAARDRDGLKLKAGDVDLVVVPEHDWTLKIGRGWYGIQGYPWATRLVFGPRSAMIRLPFSSVAAFGLAAFAAMGMFFCYCLSRTDPTRRGTE